MIMTILALVHVEKSTRKDKHQWYDIIADNDDLGDIEP